MFVMFESTLRERENQGAHWCVVFDSRNGNVVHTHLFIDHNTESCETEDLEAHARTALQVAQQVCDASYLQVMHAPPDFHFEPGMTCHVDLASGKLLAIIEPNALRDMIKLGRASTDCEG